jgi:hypothetical protein
MALCELRLVVNQSAWKSGFSKKFGECNHKLSKKNCPMVQVLQIDRRKMDTVGEMYVAH